MEEIAAMLDAAVDDVDAEIIKAIRDAGKTHHNAYQNAFHGLPPSRENLLSQLDVLEKVRERLNVRYDRNNHE